MSGGGNPGIGQMQAVGRAPALGPGREAGSVQNAVQEVAGTISGKHTSCSISAMCGRRQTKNQHPGRRVAERGHGLAPVVPVEKSAAFGNRDFAAMTEETGAFFALYNFPIENDKTLVTEKVSRYRHEIIMAFGNRIMQNGSQKYMGSQRNTLTWPPETRENIHTGCSPVMDSGFQTSDQPRLAIFSW